MSSPPQISTTTVSATPTATPPTQPPGTMPTSSYVYFSCEYLATFSGILKVICLASLFIGFMCAVNSGSPTAVLFKVVSMVLLILTSILFLLYLFNVPNVHSGAPWLNCEFFSYGGGALLMGVASVLVIFGGEIQLFVAGCFGFAATFAFGYDSYVKYKEYTAPMTNVVA